MGDVVGDVIGFVEEAADAVAEVVGTVTDPLSNVVETIVSPIAEAVSAIPVVGDVVGMAAPFGGILGSVVGGPLGGAIGGALGNAFDGEGGSFDFLDTAIGVFGGDLPGPLADIAGNLLDGGSLIDNAASVFGGDIGGMAETLLGGQLGGLLDGDLGDMAQNILGGNLPNIGDLGGIAGQVFGGDMPDLGGLSGIVGQVLGDGEMPDLSDIGGLGGLIKTADSVFGGLGLGNLGSAAAGIAGDCMPDLSDAGGWLNNLPDSLPGPFGAGGGDGGFELPFGMGSFPSIPDLTGPISQGGGDWIGVLQDQAATVGEFMGGGCWDTVSDWTIDAEMPYLPVGWSDRLEDLVNGPDVTIQDVLDPPFMTDRDTDLDDLVFSMPGVDGDGAARDALQQLADAGNLGEALASLSQDDLTSLVTRLVAPTASPAIDTIVDNAATSGQALDDLGLPSSVIDGVAQQPVDDFGDDLATVGADAGLGGADAAGGLGDDAMADQGAATSGLADGGQDAQIGGQDDFDDGLGLGGLGSDVDGGVAQPEPVIETFTPEPEPESDFSQQIAQADAVEDSFDSMFDDLGGQGQG